MDDETARSQIAVELGERARFHAVRKRVFGEMQHVSSRWRFALMAPFHILVIGILGSRGFPKDRLAIQIVAFLVVLFGLSMHGKVSGRAGRIALALSGFALLVTLANTGGLASPLLVSVLPFVLAIAANPELEKKRRVFVAKFVVAFGAMAWLSHHFCCALAGPLAPEQGSLFASSEYIAIAFASSTVAICGVYFMGKGMTAAYERIALELAERREELCDENEGRTRALEGIAARLAHEVKNPLAAIKGLSTHMARSAEDPKVKERLNIVAGEAERLQEIVDGFLSFSRGLDELNVATTKPYEIARELQLLLETRAADAGVSIEVRGSRELALEADGKKLRQALLNLVLNAMQASTAGATITLEVAKSCSDGAAVIRILDRGAGMTPEILARISKPYFTTKEGGSGLGIAIARGIIEQHGGTLKFESTSGRGTTATIMLPAAACPTRQRLPNPCRALEAALEKRPREDAKDTSPEPAFAQAAVEKVPS